MNDNDLRHLRRCVELAELALDGGDEPFGSVLVTGDGRCWPRTTTGWPAATGPATPSSNWPAGRRNHLSPEERRAATVYTSGEHCPMCAAAHAWVGLGRIVYATSTAQLTSWLGEWGVPSGPVAPLPIGQVAPGVSVEGPSIELEAQVKQLYRQAFTRG